MTPPPNSSTKEKAEQQTLGAQQKQHQQHQKQRECGTSHRVFNYTISVFYIPHVDIFLPGLSSFSTREC